MANTKIPVELSSTPGIVDGSNATAITIDSSERVGIGTTSPSVPLDIVTNLSSDTTTSPDTVLTIATKYASTGTNGGAGAGPRLEFQIPDDETNPITGAAIAGIKEAADDSDASAGMAFYISQNDTTLDEAMRIDHDGKVGIGCTPVQPFQVRTQSDGNAVFQNSTSVTGGVKINCFNDAANASKPFEIDGSSLQFNIAATEKMRIDSSGNVAIGTTSVLSGNKLDVRGGNIMVGGYGGGTDYGLILTPDDSSAYFNIANITGGHLTFNRSSTINNYEKMRIDSSGTLFVGKTSSAFATAGLELYGTGRAFITHANDDVLLLNRTGSAGKILKFYDDGSEVGSISTNTHSLPSDKNFKKNINNLDLGLNLIKKLKPSQYNYKHNDDNTPVMYGLIAQDLEESLAEVGVEKNSTWLLQHNPTEDEKQSDYDLDYGKLTPILIKAIQEQQTIIETLQTTINDLKSRIETLEG